jgi:hypothetical protein
MVAEDARRELAERGRTTGCGVVVVGGGRLRLQSWVEAERVPVRMVSPFGR